MRTHYFESGEFELTQKAFGKATYAASLQDAGLFLWVFSQGIALGTASQRIGEF